MMFQDKIETPDAQLTRLLIVRHLRDQGVDIEPRKIAIASVRHGHQTAVRFRYPLRGLKISIDSSAFELEGGSADKLVQVARKQADSFAWISQYAERLEDEIAGVRVVAKAEVAKLRRSGIHAALVSVSPSPVDAGGRRYPSPEVTIEMLDITLQPKLYSFSAETHDDLVASFADGGATRDQLVRSVRKDWLKQAGAAGAIDSIVAAALDRAGIDVPQTIDRMLENENGFILEHDDAWLNLWWDDGLINASFALRAGVSYRRGDLTLDEPSEPGPRKSLIGKPARAVVDDLLLDGYLITAVDDTFGKTTVSVEPRYRLFDADTCRPRDILFPI